MPQTPGPASTSPKLHRLGDRPLGLKIGVAIAVLGLVSTSLTNLAVDRIRALSDG